MLTGSVTSCVRTAILEDVIEGNIEIRIGEEEDVSSYGVTFRKKVFEVERGSSLLQSTENSVK